jgi:hypothetical protein
MCGKFDGGCDPVANLTDKFLKYSVELSILIWEKVIPGGFLNVFCLEAEKGD